MCKVDPELAKKIESPQINENGRLKFLNDSLPAHISPLKSEMSESPYKSLKSLVAKENQILERSHEETA